MYQIIAADGREYGPVTAEEIRSWAAENRVRPETMVKTAGDHQWKLISMFPEFTDLWATDCRVPEQNPPSFVQGATEDEIQSIVEPNANYYLSRWRAMAITGGKASWNWAACIWGPSWTAYRKMYLYTWVIFAVMVAEGIIECGLNLSPVFRWGVAILVWVAFGVWGNHLYLTHARRRIAEVKLSCRDPHSQRARLAATGGSSWGSAIGISLLFILIECAIWFGVAWLTEVNGGG